jgi:LysR family transcriptional regulator (chromosome initiation inhibitor)
MLDREQLETFAAVAEHGSFERAASALNVTRGAVSQRVKALEEQVAAVLLVRERPVRPTPQGERLLRHVKTLRLLEHTTLSELQSDSGGAHTASVAIGVNADSLADWFAPVVPRIVHELRVALEIVSDDQDHTFARLTRGDVAGCVSAQARPARGFQADLLGEMEYRCLAQPAFAQQHFAGGLTLPGALRAPAVLFDRKDSLHDRFLKDRFGVVVKHYPRHYVPSPQALLEAIAAGCGYGLVPARQAHDCIASGRLVELAPEAPAAVCLYWHRWESELGVAAQITRLVLAQARSHLRRPAPTQARHHESCGAD